MSRTAARLRRAVSLTKRAPRHLVAKTKPARKRVGALTRHVPPPVRRSLSKVALRRPWRTEIPISSVLVGGNAGLTASQFAAATGDLLWPSQRVVDGPHAQLFRSADEVAPAELSDDELLGSPYAELARSCIEVSEHFFGAVDEAGILEVARSSIAQHRGGSSGGPRPVNATAPGDGVLVAPIRDSSTYQLIDGHHRLASAGVQGRGSAAVTVKWLPVQTPLQELLDQMSWIGGTRELYQPVDAPELQRWTLVRQCRDRLAKMRTVLSEEGLMPVPELALSYLDVASCYGWFVRQMEELGFSARGMERDPLGPKLGEAIYGLDPAKVDVGDCVDLLRATQNPIDIVSCFSLLHHFVLGRGSVSAEELIRLLDGATGKVLFFDTGQDHEAWFRTSLAGWDTAYVEKFLRANTTFSRIVDLGPDSDAVGAYQDNYRRHLFACFR